MRMMLSADLHNSNQTMALCFFTVFFGCIIYWCVCYIVSCVVWLNLLIVGYIYRCDYVCIDIPMVY